MTSFLFPGQGAQVKGMGKDLFDAFPELTRQADDILGYSIKALCLEDAQDQLNQTQFTQPALYVVNALAYQQKCAEAAGQPPRYLAGHSLGEYNALQAAGAFSFADGLTLVKKRGELMSQAPAGAMAAVVNMNAEAIRDLLDQHNLQAVDIANYNAPSQTVISGLKDDIATAKPIFEQANAMFFALKTSGAFHSRYMEPVKTEFAQFLANFQFGELQTPVISNIYGQPYQQADIARNLADQISHSVEWVKSIYYLLAQGENEFEELGPGNVLTKLNKKILPEFEKNKEQLQAQFKAPTQEQTSANDDPKQTLQTRIADWNTRHATGTLVNVDGYDTPLETRTPAMILFGHRAAIYMKGYNGYFALDEVMPVSV